MAMEHIIVHQGTTTHSAFPHIISLQNGDLVTIFREAPIRENMAHNHVDPASFISMVRSTDGGITWPASSHVVVNRSDGAHDLNMAMIAQHANGELIANNHRWYVVPHDKVEKIHTLAEHRRVLEPTRETFGKIIFNSLYFTRSLDNGHTWEAPQPKEIPSFAYFTHTGKDGTLQMPDGSLIAPFHGRCPTDQQDRVFVARSFDNGATWTQPSTVASDPEGKISFHEPPLLILPDGRMVMMIRTAGADGYLYQVFSDDGGWVWQGLKRTPIWGYPCHLLHLQSGRILCAFGYRREPFGIRAVLSEDGLVWDADRVKPLRTDGLHVDLGYPASLQLQDGRILTVYYFHTQEGVRYIGGTIYQEEDLL